MYLILKKKDYIKEHTRDVDGETQTVYSFSKNLDYCTVNENDIRFSLDGKLFLAKFYKKPENLINEKWYDLEGIQKEMAKSTWSKDVTNNEKIESVKIEDLNDEARELLKNSFGIIIE